MGGYSGTGAHLPWKAHHYVCKVSLPDSASRYPYRILARRTSVKTVLPYYGWRTLPSSVSRSRLLTCVLALKTQSHRVARES